MVSPWPKGFLCQTLVVWVGLK